MTNNQTLIPTVHGGRYMAHMASLISYARQDEPFADSLALFAKHYLDTNPLSIQSPSASPYLTPKNRPEATAISSWLLPIITDGTTADVRAARTLLVAWASKRILPETAVVGIIGIMIPGPTLGIISTKKKKKKSAMRMIVRTEYFKALSKKQLVRVTAAETGKQLASELKMARGDTALLHPDTFDWTFSDHKVELFTHTESGIQCALKSLREEHLPHTLIMKKDTVVGVVVSPSVDEQFVSDQGANKV